MKFNNLIKYLVPVAGLAFLAISDCGCALPQSDQPDPSAQPARAPAPQAKSPDAPKQEVYYFDRFGQVSNGKSTSEITQLKIEDMDGDGKKDIIMGDTYGRIRIYKNKIPYPSTQ